jgi:eukaryotic-like serine/threonine-protein kinase
VITLSLLHPVKQTPVQVWSFPNEPVVRIGRSSDNQVVLYSAVVSRYHVELRQSSSTWEVVSIGTNGTYVNGKRVTQMAIADGAVIRLARSGPNIQVNLGVVRSEFAQPTISLPSQPAEEMPFTTSETD